MKPLTALLFGFCLVFTTTYLLGEIRYKTTPDSVFAEIKRRGHDASDCEMVVSGEKNQILWVFDGYRVRTTTGHAWEFECPAKALISWNPVDTDVEGNPTSVKVYGLYQYRTVPEEGTLYLIDAPSTSIELMTRIGDKFVVYAIDNDDLASVVSGEVVIER